MSTVLDGTGNRRSACDRCRSHKLRCERGQLRCHRCVKANAECVTSVSLKSGRPLQLYGRQNEQGYLSQEKHQEAHSHLGHQQILPTFPTPPSTMFDPLFDAIPPYNDGGLDIQLMVSPSSLPGLDDIWMQNSGRETTATNLGRLVDSIDPDRVGNGPAVSPFSDIRGEFLNQLGALQTNLLADLEAVKACKTANKCALAETNSGPDQNYNFLVGRMLDHSAAMLKILNFFEPAEKDIVFPSNEQPLVTTRFPSHSLRCDAPTIIALFSCYVSLTRIYRTIFSCIHDSMPFLLRSQQPGPQLFPGMNLGGFKLEARLDLQVQILVQVSEEMLAKIEAKFGISEGAAVAERGIFENEKATGILRMMLEEEASEQPQLDQSRGDCESLTNILASLKGMIHTKSINKNG